MSGPTTQPEGGAGIETGIRPKRIGVVGRPDHDDVPGCVERLARFAGENEI